jgi:hypothetical protein
MYRVGSGAANDREIASAATRSPCVAGQTLGWPASRAPDAIASPEEAIRRTESRVVDGLFINSDLMLKREDMQGQRAAGAIQWAEEGKQGSNNG